MKTTPESLERIRPQIAEWFAHHYIDVKIEHEGDMLTVWLPEEIAVDETQIGIPSPRMPDSLARLIREYECEAEYLSSRLLSITGWKPYDDSELPF